VFTYVVYSFLQYRLPTKLLIQIISGLKIRRSKGLWKLIWGKWDNQRQMLPLMFQNTTYSWNLRDTIFQSWNKSL